MISRLLKRCSSCTARIACRSFAAKERSSRGSMSRATCMVRVEPPDTMRPFTTA